MFVGMINDTPVCVAEKEDVALGRAIQIAEEKGYPIHNYNYKGPNKDELSGVLVWTEEIPLVKKYWKNISD